MQQGNKTYTKIILYIGVLLLAYQILNRGRHELQVNEGSIISSFIVKILEYIPSMLVLVPITGFIIYCIWKEKYMMIGSLISLYIIDLSITISINTLSLEEISTFALFQVKTEIPYYLKEAYFNAQLQEGIKSLYPYLSESQERITFFKEHLDAQLQTLRRMILR